MEQVESTGIDNASPRVSPDPKGQRQEVAALVNRLDHVFNVAMQWDDKEAPASEYVYEQLWGKLKELVKESGSISLEIRPAQVLWKGEPVYENPHLQSLPHTLHRGGIGRLTFFQGITHSELARFFNCLRLTRASGKRVEDLFGLLQDEDFSHLTCDGADDYFVTHPLPIPGNLGALRRHYPPGAMPGARQSQILLEHCPDCDIDWLAPRIRDHPPLASRFEILNRIYLATAEEIEGMGHQILDESAPTFGACALDTLMELLLMEKSQDDFDGIVSFILRILDDSIQGGDYQGASEILERLSGCLRMSSMSEWQKRHIRKAILEAGSESRIAVIAEALRFSEEQDIDGITRYMSLLQRNAVPHLCRLLGELKGSKTRRILCDALSDLGRNSIEVFGTFLDDERWYVVRNMVYILGRIGKRDGVPYLEKALDHPDSRVRGEAVHAISLVANREKAIESLARKLSDRDSRIRGLAALRLARIGKEQALKPLLDALHSKGVQRKEIHEIRLILQAIGISGSDEAVPVLFRILSQKRFFDRTNVIRKSAAEALGTIGTPEAISALSMISKIGDDTAREASLAVLGRIGKS
jgi:hypothetical protein